MFELVPIAEASAISDLVGRVNQAILGPIMQLLFALAFIYFIYGVAKYFLNPLDTEGRADGRQHVMWGLIGLFIMFSVYGIIRLVLGTFGVSY